MCDKIYLLSTRRGIKVKNKLKIMSVVCTIITLLFVILPTVAFATEENPNNETTTTTTTTSIEELDTRSASVYIGEKYQIPSEIFTNPKYESLNSDVALVNSAGIVTGVSAGTTTIIISDSKYTQMYVITVEQKETTTAPTTTVKTLPTISSTKFITLEKGKTTTLSPSLSGYVVYSSGNTSIVYVTSKGIVRAVGTGTTYIQAHNGSYVQNYQITVKSAKETTTVEESSSEEETISSELGTVQISNVVEEETSNNNQSQSDNEIILNAQKQRNRLIIIACAVALIILIIIIVLIVKYFASRKHFEDDDAFDNNNDDFYYFNDFDKNDSTDDSNDITQNEDRISLDDFINDDDDDFFI